MEQEIKRLSEAIERLTQEITMLKLCILRKDEFTVYPYTGGVGQVNTDDAWKYRIEYYEPPTTVGGVR